MKNKIFETARENKYYTWRNKEHLWEPVCIRSCPEAEMHFFFPKSL